MASRVTRLAKRPDRRVDYTPPGKSKARKGSLQNPIVIPESPTPELPRTRSARVAIAVIPAPSENRVKKKTLHKAVPHVEKPAPHARKECSICADSKSASRSFKLPADGEACKHFYDICTSCVGKMIKTKIAERKLEEAVLACPFPGCDCVLGYDGVKQITSKQIFADWENALAMHYLRADDTFIACLSTQCGRYFCIADCTGKRAGAKHKIECPYCSYELCLTCNRPWHGRVGCNKAKAAENKQSEAEIKNMGAKPCPKCGVNIQKNGGCDHMTCNRCHHNFCWECLVTYSSTMRHVAGCRHGAQGIANDPRNFLDDRDFHPAQVEQAMLTARARMAQLPFFAPLNPPVPVPNQNVQPQDVAVPNPAAGRPLPEGFMGALQDWLFGGRPGA